MPISLPVLQRQHYSTSTPMCRHPMGCAGRLTAASRSRSAPTCPSSVCTHSPGSMDHTPQRHKRRRRMYAASGRGVWRRNGGWRKRALSAQLAVLVLPQRPAETSHTHYVNDAWTPLPPSVLTGHRPATGSGSPAPGHRSNHACMHASGGRAAGRRHCALLARHAGCGMGLA